MEFKANQIARDRQLREDQKKALILAVAREWKLNDNLRHDPWFVRYERQDFNDVHMLWTFENSQLKAVRTSDLFSYSVPRDQNFILQVINYHDMIKRLNQLIDIANGNMIAPLATKPLQVNTFKAVFDEKGPYRGFNRLHNILGQALRRDYAWVFDDVNRITWGGDPNALPQGGR
jgi:hypothetical protein